MFILHCTKKAQGRLKVNPEDCLPEATTKLGNWYCNEFTAQRRKYLMFVNERTLLPAVLSLRDVRTREDIMERFRRRLFKSFRLLEFPENQFMPEIRELEEVVFAKTQNRSVLGSMNEMILHAKVMSYSRDMDLDSPAMFKSLARIPLKANGYKYSIELVAELLQS